MANILLLEPEYKNKYPPLGLMKIAAFHREILNDYVYFSKGPLRKSLPKVKWDKIYITTLFTFEWKKTLKIINYAKELVPINNIKIGGIASTLMADFYEQTTGIRPIAGLLNTPGKLGYSMDECIDTITPDYSILDDIADYYQYPYENAYFMYTTRGCGMNCEFCAVKTLEPIYIPYISIKEQMNKINEKYGPKKDLLLMDNNVLKSQYFEEIINELIDLGFEKGATYTNPKTNKKSKRYVDFNQGLDAFLLTEQKAKLLSRISIKPARIAFDHLEDKEVYSKAINICANNNINTLSNYVLYNAENFTGKGHSYTADGPDQLYERLQLNIKLARDINKNKSDNERISIFSFPMRYIPLDSTCRGYIGSKWNAKYLRAVQVILVPTQGKVGTSESFFYTAFGKDINEFHKILDMPEFIIGLRGRYKENKKLSSEENSIRYEKYMHNKSIVSQWTSLYDSLSETELLKFKRIIKENKFNKEVILNSNNDIIIKLLLFYLSNTEFLSLFESFNNNKLKYHKKVVVNFCLYEFQPILDNLIRYLLSAKSTTRFNLSILKYLGQSFTSLLIQEAKKFENEPVIIKNINMN